MLRLLSVALLSACIAFICAPIASLAEDVEVSNIETKIIDGPNSIGNIDFAIKAEVTNKGSDTKVDVKLQALDSSGFEIKDLYLSGDIPPGETRTLSDKRMMSENDYKSIKTWQLDR